MEQITRNCGLMGIFFAAVLICNVDAAPRIANSAPLKRIVENLVKRLPKQLDEELIDPPHVRFVSIPEDAVIREGAEGVLRCEAEGIPPPTVRWTLNDNPIRLGDYSDNIVEKIMNVGKTTIQRGITVSKISIDCATVGDAGVYKCMAENGHETIEASARVGVTQGNAVSACSRSKKARNSGKIPQIYMWTDGRFEMSGANAQLYCRAIGQPKPRIQWLRSDGSVIKRSRTGAYDILPSGDLMIKDATFDSLDSYTCVAKNVHGEDRAEAFFYPSEPEEGDDAAYSEEESDYFLKK